MVHPLPQAHTASQRLATKLVRAIVHGDYPPGQRLPAERDMAESHGVSRHVVREALKRVEAIGLVQIVQGSGVYTNDMLLAGGLELFEYLLFDEEGRLDSGALAEFLTFWTLFVPDVFRLAASHHTPEDLVDLHLALDDRAESLHDLARFVEANQRLLRAVAKATHNSVYQLIFNNLGRVFLRLRMAVPLDQLAPLTAQDELRRMIGAVEARDAELAAFLARRQTELGREGLDKFLQTLSKHELR
jgi:DNA-binding FadR family transcriptional regulator